MKNIIIVATFLVLVSSGCSQSAQPIEYGKDNCHFCQMKIMDPKFGSEAITQKGRIYKFDSSECLLRYLNGSDQQHSHLLVTPFNDPKHLVDATSSWFLVSKNMPSPMGGNLNAFNSEDDARAFMQKNGGDVFNWEGVKALYTKE